MLKIELIVCDLPGRATKTIELPVLPREGDSIELAAPADVKHMGYLSVKVSTGGAIIHRVDQDGSVSYRAYCNSSTGWDHFGMGPVLKRAVLRNFKAFGFEGGYLEEFERMEESGDQ